MSVREFAAELSYSPRNRHVSVYRLENGDRRPSQQAIMLMKQLRKEKTRTSTDKLRNGDLSSLAEPNSMGRAVLVKPSN